MTKLTKLFSNGNSDDEHQLNAEVSPLSSEAPTLIKAESFASKDDLSNIWKYRELLYFLALRDVKIRYKQTLLGIAWVLLQPIITTAIFTVIFTQIGTDQKLPVPYPLFAFSGFILWTFMSSVINNCSGSLVNHSNLITKIYFPRLIIPFSATLATLLDLVFGLLSFTAAMLIYRVVPGWNVLLLPVVIVPALLLSLGIGIFTAALNVKYRDVKYILPFLLQVFFFISPVFYSVSMMSSKSAALWQLNPLTGILENFRALSFGMPLNYNSLGISVIVALLIFLAAVYVFHGMEEDFADII